MYPAEPAAPLPPRRVVACQPEEVAVAFIWVDGGESDGGPPAARWAVAMPGTADSPAALEFPATPATAPPTARPGDRTADLILELLRAGELGATSTLVQQGPAAGPDGPVAAYALLRCDDPPAAGPVDRLAGRRAPLVPRWPRALRRSGRQAVPARGGSRFAPRPSPRMDPGVHGWFVVRPRPDAAVPDPRHVVGRGEPVVRTAGPARRSGDASRAGPDLGRAHSRGTVCPCPREQWPGFKENAPPILVAIAERGRQARDTDRCPVRRSCPPFRAGGASNLSPSNARWSLP